MTVRCTNMITGSTGTFESGATESWLCSNDAEGIFQEKPGKFYEVYRKPVCSMCAKELLKQHSEGIFTPMEERGHERH